MNTISKSDRTDLLVNTLQNALLHLYLRIQSSKAVTPKTTRNSILKRWLEPKLKSRTHKPIKTEIKLLLLNMKKNKADLETELNYVLDAMFNTNLNENNKNVKDVVDYFNNICPELFKLKIYKTGVDIFEDTMYLPHYFLADSFSADGKLIEPFTIHIKTDKIDKLEKHLTESGQFNFSIESSDNNEHTIKIAP
ncbi:DUF2913 family protein [Photobacterium kishitanii]|uniref:DUF2913 domain-containing protein n=1 Tax=Photobacterium kishitanii TaxID=318456 RepID=A0A2T3KLY5_9GAMM|nr:DUF2913 family protein [Photobacterium kishitanii]PSV00708.1 hypothetical protein C9J27_06085 [Photobacterium kishitanii]